VLTNKALDRLAVRQSETEVKLTTNPNACGTLIEVDPTVDSSADGKGDTDSCLLLAIAQGCELRRGKRTFFRSRESSSLRGGLARFTTKRLRK
jgi:hypothetical protein